MKKDLKKLLDFVKFTHEIRNVRRAIILDGENRENDAEHGYQLALVAWFLIENDGLNLDKYRCVGMAMVHDIAEAYAGDTIAFASKKDLATQRQKEEEAIAKLRENWPSFSSLHTLIEEYEHHKTPEGQFVYSLDKLIPIINNYLYEGKIWKKEGITLERIKEIKKGKVDESAEVNEYYQELLKILEKRVDLFGKNWGEL